MGFEVVTADAEYVAPLRNVTLDTEAKVTQTAGRNYRRRNCQRRANNHRRARIRNDVLENNLRVRNADRVSCFNVFHLLNLQDARSHSPCVSRNPSDT